MLLKKELRFSEKGTVVTFTYKTKKTYFTKTRGMM
jgi:hypothetical protein